MKTIKSPKAKILTLNQCKELGMNKLILRLAEESINEFGHYTCLIGNKPHIITK